MRRRVVVLVAVVVAVAVGLLTFSVGQLSTLNDPTPTTVSAEAGFARDMQVHHNQGVQLAMIIRDRTDDPDVRRLAYDIATAQAQQSGQMYGWLEVWGLPQYGSQPPMSWMSGAGMAGMEGDGQTMEPGGDGLMPGLATPEQIVELQAASGVEAERIFLELMITHHMAAVDMADAVLELSDNTVVTRLAGAIVRSQSAEMELMRTMLAERQ